MLYFLCYLIFFSLHAYRQSSIVADKSKINSSSSIVLAATTSNLSITTATLTTSSSHIPVYQYSTNLINHTSNILNGSSKYQPLPSHHSNPFQYSLSNTTNENLDSEQFHMKNGSHANQSVQAQSANNFQQSNTPILPAPERDRIEHEQTAKNFSARNPFQFDQTKPPLHFDKLPESIAAALPKHMMRDERMTLTKSPPPPLAPQPIDQPAQHVIQHDTEYSTKINNNQNLANNYSYQQQQELRMTSPDPLNRSKSPKISNIDHMEDELNELYKATMRMHVQQQQIPQPNRPTYDDYDGNLTNMRREIVYNNLGELMSLLAF